MSSLRRALLALAISMAVPVCAAQAATFVVDRGDDADVSTCSAAANDCTLRGAINRANAGAGADTINFVTSDTQSTSVSVTGLGLPAIAGELTISSPRIGAVDLLAAGYFFKVPAGSKLTISGFYIGGGSDTSAGNRGGIVDNAGTVVIRDCGLNNSTASGGALYNEGTLELTNSVVTSSTNGSGVRNVGILTVRGCTFSDNTSTGRGAGIDNTGALTVSDSAFLDNTAGADGAGIFTVGSKADISNCTFSGNRIPSGARGGAICSGDGGLSIDSSTLTRNTADAGNGGGFFCKSNGVVRNSIVAGNNGDDVSTTDTGTTPFRSLGYNIVGTGTGGNAIGRFNAPGDRPGISDAKLGPLTSSPRSGSPIADQFYPLLGNSPALNNGNTDLATDQRGVARPQGVADDIGAYESTDATPAGETPSLVVNTLSDVIASDGQNSLREAMGYANIKAGADTITFAANLSGTIKLNGTRLPLITDDLTIQGNKKIVLDGDGKSGILQIDSKALTVSLLTLRNGSSDAGGAIRTRYGTLNVFDCVLSGNRGQSGGAVLNGGGSATIARCTFSGNSADNFGGGAVASDGSLVVSYSTFNGNSAIPTSGFAGGRSGNGGAISNNASANSADRTTIFNCTFSANRAARAGGALLTTNAAKTSIDSCTFTLNSAPNGAGIASEGVNANLRSTTLVNTIVAGNTGGVDVFDVPEPNSPAPTPNTFTSGGHNLVGTSSANFNAPGDQSTGNPKLGPLANNGGPTQTHAPLADSPALDTGATNQGYDQRGVKRPQGAADDIGVYESRAATPPAEAPSLIVTTTADVAANDGQTSLREAIAYANSKAGADSITFASNVRGTITLASPLPPVTDVLSINGPGAPVLAVDGGGKVRLLRIAKGVTADINYLTLSGAKFDASQGTEGALLNEGTLILRQLAMTNNTGINGGAITNLKGSVSLFGCQISSNLATNGGGGLFNNDGTMIVFNSTINNNYAVGRDANASGGGGVSSVGANAYTALEYVTLAGNFARNVAGGARAGVWIQSGAFMPHNSIVWGNGAGDFQIDGGTLNSSGYNIIGTTSSGVGLAGTDRVGINPRIGGLTDNGGSTKTQALWPGSPAINSGDPAYGNGFDQRGDGFPRRRGGRIDVGAFEVQSDATTSAQAAPNSSVPSAIATGKAPSGGNS